MANFPDIDYTEVDTVSPSTFKAPSHSSSPSPQPVSKHNILSIIMYVHEITEFIANE